jgi:hypothetical protein
MPAQQGVRCHEERAPTPAREEAAGGGEEGSISGSKRGPSNLAATNPELVAKHHDLELLELPRATADRDELEHPPHRDIKKRGKHTRPPLLKRTKAHDSTDASALSQPLCGRRASDRTARSSSRTPHPAIPFIWDKTAAVQSRDVDGVASGYYITHDLTFTSLKD